MTDGIERVTILHGHTSTDTAYQVDDYPHGFHLRCKIRYWIETATKGGKKGQQRFVTQTTNPRRGNVEWNKPKPATYVLLAVMYLDSAGHMQWTGVSEYGMAPDLIAQWQFNGIHEQLTEPQRAYFDRLADRFQRANPTTWNEWETRVAALAAHLQQTGDDPILTNGVWTPANRHPLYIGQEKLPVYLAAARQRLT